MNHKARLAIASAAAVAALGGVGATLAYAGPPTPTPTPSSSPTATPSEAGKREGHRRPLLRRALHGEATLAGRAHRVVAFQRGEVTSVSSSALAVRSVDGFVATYDLGPEVRVRQDREDAAISAVKVGTKVRVVATKEGSTLEVRRIVVVG